MSYPRGDPKPPRPDLDREKVILSPLRERIFFRCADKNRPLIDWDNREKSRFSHPNLTYPVLYLAGSKQTAFRECFGDELNDQLPEERLLYKNEIEPRQWVKFKIPKINIFDSCAGKSLSSIGADASSFLAPYPITQEWSRFLMTTSAMGIRYRSRLDPNKFCLAIFGRDSLVKIGAISAQADGDLIRDTSFLRGLAKQTINVV